MLDFEPLVAKLEGHQRIAIAGGPRCGKSTIAVRAGERYGIPVRHADSVVLDLEAEDFPRHERWSEASRRVCEWLQQPGPWIIEGVSVPRALRKLLAATDAQLDMAVLWMGEPIQMQNDGQRAMHKGCVTVWREIALDLKARGVVLINDESFGAPVEVKPEPRVAEEEHEVITQPFGCQRLSV